MQPFTVSEMEPISEYVSKLYSNYPDIWVKVTSHMKDAAQKRADLVNRYRKDKDKECYFENPDCVRLEGEDGIRSLPPPE